ncbi:MAG TPA: hypothetical protein VF530_05015 [Planctomycetota bacterium]
MDGLALLCNLHADGPVTLKRLRLARVASLAELERTPPERLASWLHASIPQARAFLEEARKLGRRLAEATPASAPRPVAAEPRAALPVEPEPGPPRLKPGLLPGLDEVACARLERQNVRTLQALSERAGLDLARRTGIPYSTLLALARAARKLLVGPARPASAAAGAVLNEYELQPFLAIPRRAPPETELAGSDAFTLPPGEPESAGPFG